MPKRQSHADGEPASRALHSEHCLYLLAEADRVIAQTSAGWSPAEAGLVKSRLLQISERLTRFCTARSFWTPERSLTDDAGGVKPIEAGMVPRNRTIGCCPLHREKASTSAFTTSARSRWTLWAAFSTVRHVNPGAVHGCDQR